MRPLFLASFIIKLSPSMTKMNSSGDKGQPCLIPREAGKKLEGVPLTKTAKLTEEIQLMIQLTVRSGTPIWIKISLIYVQSTRSKALVRSSLRTKAQEFLS